MSSLALAEGALQRGDLQGAEKILSALVSESPSSPEAWYYLGTVFARTARHRDAAAAIERSLTLAGDFFEGLHDLGILATMLGKPTEAVTLLEKAQALRPRSWEVLNDKGIALSACGRFHDAIEAYDQALLLSQRREAFPWLNKGVALHDSGRFRESIAAYQKAAELKPDYIEAWCNRAYVLLTLGEFSEGFRLYEQRWRYDDAKERHTGIPRWRGDASLAGKRILLWAEQGYGDTVQFCRYAPLVAQLGAEVTIEVQRPLKNLIATLGRCTTVAQDELTGHFDYQSPLLSLPLAFRTTLESIPSATPYLKASPERVRYWKERLPHAGRIRAGIACSGRRTFKYYRQRSIPLREFAPLLPHAELFLLQTELGDEDRAALQEDKAFRYLGDQLQDFQDTAAVVSNLDLVITADTALAHVAGALGKPTWILLSWVPAWQWLLDRDDSPWYPSARLFRQKQPGSWDQVLKEVAGRLERLAPTASSSVENGAPGRI